MISDEHRFIFVHINRTGGTSIEKLFDYPFDWVAEIHENNIARFGYSFDGLPESA